MSVVSFGEWRPDVSDFQGTTTETILNVLPRGDGYGAAKALLQFALPLPAACRGGGYARKTDGTIVVFGATSDQIFQLDNTTLDWIPVSKVVALTSISLASPAVFTLASHGLVNGRRLRLTTTGTLPTGLSAGVTYYVVNAAANTFNVALTSGGTAINTTGAGSGTHSMTYLYSSLPSTDNWQLTQFGNNVVAVQANVNPQTIDISTSNPFADLGGSPPACRYATVVGHFLVLCGLTSNPTRVQWSDLDGITTWTAGVGFSNFTDLPDGGVVRGVAGGEFGLVLQETVARRLTYANGAKPAFQIERLGEEIGLLGANSLIRAGARIFFYSARGFQAYLGGQLVPIGKERVDRTFAADLDTGSLRLLIGASDPASTRVSWAYKSINGQANLFDKIIHYDYVLDRWATTTQTGEYILSMTKPGLTLDALDSISTSIDALTFSLDDVSSAVLSSLSAVDSSHQLGFFTGTTLEATMETPEQNLGGTQRVMVNGLMPITDAPTVFGSMKVRKIQGAAATQTTETALNTNGVCPQRVDTRYARARLRIPAGTAWTFCAGAEPQFRPTGQR